MCQSYKIQSILAHDMPFVIYLPTRIFWFFLCLLFMRLWSSKGHLKPWIFSETNSVIIESRTSVSLITFCYKQKLNPNVWAWTINIHYLTGWTCNVNPKFQMFKCILARPYRISFKTSDSFLYFRQITKIYVYVINF